MEQTLQLLEKPVDSASSALPESISLAVKMKSNEVLYEVFKSIDVDQEISAEVADQALSSLEATFDTNRESAHLSQEIYSAI